MKVKTSVTLSPDVLTMLDRLAGRRGSRSAVIERIVREFVMKRQQATRAARDVAILNMHSDYLNREAADVLAYQTWPGEQVRDENQEESDDGAPARRPRQEPAGT